MVQRSLWQRVRRIWVTLGLAVTVVFFGWVFFGYRASPTARDAMRTDSRVEVLTGDGVIRFTSETFKQKAPVGLVFFAGALVDPRAYAPLGRAVAMAGYPVILVPLPRRGAFGGADSPELLHLALGAINEDERASQWVIGGHSRGAVVAIKMAREMRALGANTSAGLLLVGTTHPRDVDLSKYPLPVTKIVGTKDGVAPIAKVEANAHLLPASTHWVRIEGGNHSQFGWYGFQPGDRFASISREQQHEQLVAAVKEALRIAAEHRSPLAPP